MSGLNLNAFAENATRLGMRLQETLSEHTRELAITRGASSVYLDGAEDKVKDVRRQLDSNSDREKLDAMKRLIALISKGRNVSEYFAQVVKNVASQNLEIRKLVYIYLLRYAEQEPDLALLSINTFQKDLNDPSPLIRAMALRVLSGIKVPMIGSLVILAIKKCSADFSPYVRKGAALAIPKFYELDSSHLPALIEIISTLLNDRSPLSIGSVAVAFDAVCPTRFDLLHSHYRRLCRTLVDVDEWGQIDLLHLLTKYARVMLPKSTGTTDEPSSEEIDKDMLLLLASSAPLFQSRNPAVILAVARAFYYLGPPSYTSKIVQPLLRLLSSSREVERVVLPNVLLIAHTHPHLFAGHYSRFFIRSDDHKATKLCKIRFLLIVLNVDNHQALLREFIDYADDLDEAVCADAIHAIGRCTRLIPECTQQCLTALMAMIKTGHDAIVSNAVLVLKSLVRTQPLGASTFATRVTQSSLNIISHLARKIDDIHHPEARACVVWLAGQYSTASDSQSHSYHGIVEWVPDLLRKSARRFGQEDHMVKLQIITLAAKVLALNSTDQRLSLLARYVFSLARYDVNYDVRDRARMLEALLAGISPNLPNSYKDVGGVVLRQEQVKLVLFEGKNNVVEEDLAADEDHSLLGSLELITKKDMRGDNLLPDWLERGIDSTLRDEPDATPIPQYAPAAVFAPQRFKPSSWAGTPVTLTPTEGSSPSGASKVPWTDLEKFYEDESDEEGQEESTATESDDGSEQERGENGEEDINDEEDDEEHEEDDDEEDEDEEVGVDGHNKEEHIELSNDASTE